MNYNEKLSETINLIVRDYQSQFSEDVEPDSLFMHPDKNEIEKLIQKLLNIVYLGYFNSQQSQFPESKITLLVEEAATILSRQVRLAFSVNHSYEESKSISQEITIEFLNKIPQIREYLETDLQAAYDGDPAAYSKAEIVLSYPGFYAISVNRFAHELFVLHVPLIPRMMTEIAHSQTGIDIHPGATIGRYFFIDHGTGVVIGETTSIGENVRVYQGVTLGALSLRGGQSLKGKKRHPTIGDNVTIYSGASILGGSTVIGKNCVIGSNSFITSSIPDNTKVSIQNQKLNISSENKDENKWSI